MDRKLVAGALLLLLIQGFLLTADLDGLIGSDSWREDRDTKPIGVILDKKASVKRRMQGSVVWEDSQKHDNLLGHDSLLTLENSSAQLQLENDVRINVHENTLIVLEPPTDSTDESLKIRFSRGNFLARNSNRRFQVGSGEWKIEAQPGTDLSVKTLADEKVEVQVTSGSLLLQNSKDPGKTEAVTTGTRLTLSKNAIEESREVTSELKFLLQPEERVYSHIFPIRFVVRWEGHAQELRVARPGERPEHIPIQGQDTTLDLSPGTHFLSLIDKQRTSSEIVVRALIAPQVRYTSPLPRDRFAFGSDILFAWIPLEGATSYEVELTDQNGQRLIVGNSKTAKHAAPVQLEGPLLMRVYGVDEKSFRMPPHYSQTIFNIVDPLAPPRPQTITPQVPPLREPANQSPDDTPAEKTPHQRNGSSRKHPQEARTKTPRASLFCFVVACAFAEESPSDHAERPPQTPSPEPSTPTEPSVAPHILFSWFKVQGADFYTIEISSERDFFSPEVIVKVHGETFAWTDFQKKTYYWRVAAGANSGRMGLFSETAKLDLSKFDKLKAGEISPGVQLIAPVAAKPRAAPKIYETVAPKEASAPKPDAATPPPAQKDDKSLEKLVADTKVETKPSIRIYDLSIGLHHFSYSMEQTFSASLYGFATASAGAGLTIVRPDESLIRGRLSYAYVTWEPENPGSLPFQDNLSSHFYSINAVYLRNRRDFGFGAHFEALPVLKRHALEELDIAMKYLGGPIGAYDVEVTKQITFDSTGGILFGSGVASIVSRNQLNYEFTKSKLPMYLGGDFDFQLFFGSESLSGFYLKTGLHLGAHW